MANANVTKVEFRQVRERLLFLSLSAFIAQQFLRPEPQVVLVLNPRFVHIARPLCHVSVPFPAALIKYPDKHNPGEKGIVWIVIAAYSLLLQGCQGSTNLES